MDNKNNNENDIMKEHNLEIRYVGLQENDFKELINIYNSVSKWSNESIDFAYRFKQIIGKAIPFKEK